MNAIVVRRVLRRGARQAHADEANRETNMPIHNATVEAIRGRTIDVKLDDGRRISIHHADAPRDRFRVATMPNVKVGQRVEVKEVNGEFTIASWAEQP